jgi:hypothetical protein
MKQFKRNLQLALATLFAVSGLAVVPVFAHEGSDSGNSGSGGSDRKAVTVSSEVSDSSSDDSSDTSEDKPTGRLEELRLRAKKELSEDRAQKKEARKTEAKQKSCEAREANLNKKVKNFGAAAQRHLDRLDKTYAKLKAYQEEHKLNADQYEALVAVADAKQEAAKAAVEALKTVAVDIDCTSSDPAESVATVKAAVKNARTALQQYHTAVKDVLVELMTSKSDSKKDGSDDKGTDTSNSTDDNTGGSN